MKNLAAILLLTLTLASCKKNMDDLPDNTATGANTFGAKVNGEIWGPMKFGIAQTAPILAASFAGGDNYMINARNFASSPTETEMEIFLYNVTEPGIYPLNQNVGLGSGAGASYAYYVERRFTPKNEWITNQKYTGVVTITRVDKAAKVLAGTFSFQAMNMRNDPTPLTVTEGRFDLSVQ